MLIFDKLMSRFRAEEFATTVDARHGLAATVYDTQDQSDPVDIFPSPLDPPIALVRRADSELEAQAGLPVKQFGGRFSGT